jgi:uncharacterized protein YoxC
METVLSVSKIIVLLSLSALCIYVIVVLGKVRNTIVNLGKDVKDLNAKVAPVMENLDAITGKVRRITENLNDEVAIVRSSAEAVRDMTLHIVEFERKVQQQMEGPVLEAVGFLAAIVKGVRTFLHYMRGRDT